MSRVSANFTFQQFVAAWYQSSKTLTLDLGEYIGEKNGNLKCN
jgi:hypothetical protein